MLIPEPPGSGPFNHAAVLPPEVAKRILELDFVEMSEISMDDTSPPTPGQPPLPTCPPIQNISVWVESSWLWQPCWHSVSDRRPESYLPIRHRLLELDETLMSATGLPMTVAIGEKLWPKKISTGRSQTPASTTRLSPATLGSFHGTPSTSRRITSPRHALIILIDDGSAGSMTILRQHQVTPLTSYRSAAASTAESANSQPPHATTHIADQTVGGPIHASTARRAANRAGRSVAANS